MATRGIVAMAWLVPCLGGCHGPPVNGADGGGGIDAGSDHGSAAGTGGRGGSSGSGGAGSGGVGSGGAGTDGGHGSGGSGTGGSDYGTGGASPGTGGSGTGGTSYGTGGSGTGGAGTGGAGTGGSGTGGGADGGVVDPNIVWEYIGDPLTEPYGVVVDSAGIIHVVGRDRGTPGGGWYLRLDGDGHKLHAETDTQSRIFAGIAADASDHLYLAGTTAGGQALLRWRDATGTAWGLSESISVPGNSEWDAVTTDSQGRIIVAGRKYNNDVHMLLRRYAPAGTYDMDVVHTSPWDGAVAVAVDGANNIFVAGREEVVVQGSDVAGTAVLSRFTAAGAFSYAVRIPNKTSCPTTPGYYTNAWGVTVDNEGMVWFVGTHCDGDAFLRRYVADTGAPVTSADFPTGGGAGTIGVSHIHSDGVGLAISGSGYTAAIPSNNFILRDADLSGTVKRTVSRFVTGSDTMTDVAFIGRDRIVIGYVTDSSGGINAWVARVRAPPP